jgi:TolB-like protein
LDLREQLQETLGTTYRLERELGGGGMSRVFVARDIALDRAVVVKVLSEEQSQGASADRFRREIQVIARLQHPHVVGILSAGAAGGALYYVMPFLGGESLRARLSREGPMPVPETTRILREVLDALSFAHAHGVIHRDIKPENILLDAGHAVVADFGVAKALLESGTLTSVGMALGTPAYMAPEQATADPTADHRADLYAVGVVAYEILTGTTPFTGSPQQMISAHLTTPPVLLRQRRPDVPPTLADLVMRALEKDADRRPQSASEMLAMLETVATPGTGTMPLAVASPRRRPVAAIAAGAGLLVVGALGTLYAMRPTVMASAQSIAIAPFSVADGDTALVRLGQNLVTTVSANLDGVGEIRTADAMAVLSHARSRGALLSVADAAAIGRTLGARSVVHGTLVRTGGVVRADAGLYDVNAPDSPMERISVTASPDSLAALTDSLTWYLLRRVWNRGTAPTPNVASITTHSPVALREFLEGERLFSRGAMTEAGEAYRRAVLADTSFLFAAYRHRHARGWFNLTPDSAVVGFLNRNRARLPERERALVAAGDSNPTQTIRVARLRRVTQQFPEYAPAWMALADWLIHHAVRAGHDVRDAIEPWRQVTRLMPGDMEAANHLVYACLAAGDLACARQGQVRFDSLVRSDSLASDLERVIQRQLRFTLGPPGAHLVDSLFDAGLRDSLNEGPSAFSAVVLSAAIVEAPDLMARFDDLGSAIARRGATVSRPIANDARVDHLYSRAVRGEWASLDSAIAARQAARVTGFGSASLADLQRGRLLAEISGALPPRRETTDEALRVVADPAATPAARRIARWRTGVSALLRGDSAEVRGQLGELARDTSRFGAITARSLRALALGWSGQRLAAGESLLVIEREHGERAFMPTVFAANRLFGAQWLVEGGRYAAADSLLRFTQGYIFGTTLSAAAPVFAAAQLERSRIAEALGNRDEAIRFATIFVRMYDLAPPEHQAKIEEAKQRIARLGGSVDAAKSQRVPP